MARQEPQINIRLPADLKDRLDAAAIENRKSLTAEVVTRLEESLRVEQFSEEDDEITPELLDFIKSASPETPQAAAMNRLNELREEAEHQAVLLYLGELEFRRLKLKRLK